MKGEARPLFQIGDFSGVALRRNDVGRVLWIQTVREWGAGLPRRGEDESLREGSRVSGKGEG